MKLQGRNLSVGLRGEDVQLLQSELRQLGYEILQQEFQDGLFRESTEKAVREFQRKHEIEATGIVDNRTATLINAEVDKLNPFIVKGQIRKADGSVAVGVTVVAFDKDLRSEQALGKVEADTEGRYQIQYTAQQFQRLEKKTADLIVRVFGEDETQVTASPIIFNAKPVEIVDLMVGGGQYQGLSEYERYMADIQPLLGRQDLANLREDPEENLQEGKFRDISFLAGETGINPAFLQFLVLAAQLGNRTEVHPALFYGFFRQNLPTDLAALLTQHQDILRRALEAAWRNNIIPVALKHDLAQILQRLESLQVQQPEFLVKPEVLFGSLADLNHLSEEESGFITVKLNDHLRRELLKLAGNASETMVKALQTAITRIHYQQVQDVKLASLLQNTVLPEIKKNSALAAEASQIENRLAGTPSEKVSDLLYLHEPLKDNPLFNTEIQRGKTFAYTKLAGLNEEVAKNLATRNLLLDDLNDSVLADLVEEGVLSDQQKITLKLTVDLGKLTGDNLSFVSILKTPERQSIADFISWEPDDWQQRITNGNIALPPGEMAATYAETIVFNLEKTYPSQALFSRLFHPQRITQFNLLNGVQQLLTDNQKLIDGTTPASINWDRIEAESRKRLQADLQTITDFANTYQHLEIADVINDKTIDLAQKKERVNARLQSLERFYQNNPDFDLRWANFLGSQGDSFNWNDISTTDRPLVKKQLMAYQRSLTLTETISDSQVLLSKGYDSAVVIASKSEAEFVETSGLERGKARMTYAKAQASALTTAHNFETIRDTVRGGFQGISVGNISPKLVNDLREIEGFADLFGCQNYCDCEDCKSILSPAAYFVDLMDFIEQKVSKPVFISKKRTNHPLYLKNRRNDLWPLNLTCENTYTLVPYLTIVNEVLETYLNQVVSGDIFERLSRSSENISFSLPFNLPWEELHIYLGHFGLTLYEIYRTLKQPDAKVWRTRLHLSQKEFDVITTPKLAEVKFRFGNPASFNNFDTQDFIRLAGISREQLDELRSLTYNPDLKAILVVNQSTSDNLQNCQEVMKNLTDSRLDFIHRFLRLWKKTAWSIPELDLVLTSLKNAGSIGSDLNPAVIFFLAQLLDLQAKLKLTVEELCSMIHYLPVSQAFPFPPAKEDDHHLYERLFDLNKIFGEKNPNTHEIYSTVTFHHYSVNTNSSDPTFEPKTPLLLGGLGITETELLLLFDLLKNEIPIDAKGNCELDRGKISLLYRHARLAKALKFNIEDFIQVLRLNFAPAHLVVKSLEQIYQLIQFKDWLKSSPFNVFALRLIVKGEESTTVKFTLDLDAAVTLVQEIQAAAAPDQIQALQASLSKAFNLTANQLTDALQWVSSDINSSAIQTALNATITSGVPNNPSDLTALLVLVNEVERVLLLFSNLKFKPETITYLTNKSASLGIVELKHLTIDNLKALTSYKDLIAVSDAAESIVQTVLNNYSIAQTFLPEDTAKLADLWTQDKTLIASVINSLSLPTVAIAALQNIWAYLNLCQTLGINGLSLQKLADDTNFDNLSAARDVALGAFGSKYEDETVRQQKLEPYQDRINVKKRDALCDYIIARQNSLKFSDLRDIYNFFLLDVEMSGCFRTSRLVCAISSLQLYVHRCLINLEQSAPKLNPNIVNIQVDPTLIPTNEWDWRKNYRVWEANRKVFLYPENYMEPDLRDNKSPIFRELEDELLQQKITQESAEAAYKKYVSQFADLARLKIVGSYYDNKLLTYYFFGRNPQDPPEYYYRKWINSQVWTAWEKIDLGINAPNLAAIIHLGKLYIFWVDVNIKEENSIKNGNAKFDRFEYDITLNYSFLNETKKWVIPKKVKGLYTFPHVQELSGATNNEELIQTLQQINNTFKNFPRLANLNSALIEMIGKLEEQDADELNMRKKALETFLKDSFVLSKGIKKVYPYLIGASAIYIEYAWKKPYINLATGQTIHDLALPDSQDTKLSFLTHELETAQPKNKYKKPVVRLCKLEDGTSILGVSTFNYLSEETVGRVDNNLEWKEKTGLNLLLTYPFDTAKFSPEITILPNSLGEFILTLADQQFLIELAQQKSMSFLHPNRLLVRLTTSLVDSLEEVLFNQGLTQFLSLQTQKQSELSIGISSKSLQELLFTYEPFQHLPFRGPYGEYYREMFFHIPFLIANHLNANQKFKEAKWWYERIFDPTANESQNDEKPKDRNWRYLEFRDVTLQKMKDILTDEATIEQYKQDPFNPHAIARLRLSAYQKAIVMKYIDNLLDWGDALFAQDTMESLNEATMLYVLAFDILGKRPAKLGECKTASDDKLTYQNIGPAISKGSEFLITLENWHQSNLIAVTRSRKERAIAANAKLAPVTTTQLSSIGLEGATREPGNSATITLSGRGSMAELKPQYQVASYTTAAQEKLRYREATKKWEVARPIVRDPGTHIHQTTPVFCVPPNYNLLKYWDRVEDRLFKIRNCMNISGVRRQLSLFQPPIDPMALVRAKAAGLSLEDIQGILDAPLPPYRFSYLIEKAKQYTQTVQSFGSALLSALEKKDVEDLTMLRSVHERNILNLTKAIKKQQVREAQYHYQASIETKTNVQNRIDYYQGLIDAGLTGWEATQEISTHTATGFEITASTQKLLGGILSLLPQLGSPFAMKYGGVELSNNAQGIGLMLSSLASIAHSKATSAGLEASFQRREQEWQQQLLLAQQELTQVEQQRLAADIRQLIAGKDLEIHEKNIEQADELNEFYKNKFTNLGLYNYLSTTLNRLYSEAYNIAQDMAKMAEKAYKFERDDSTIFIAGDNWQFDRAGLLAGERLLLQLQRMEKAYLENHQRDYEVTQSFSLALLNPSALLTLKQTGNCQFTIPEIMFDLFYPGQYKRLIKSVRITIPCVTGPYTNISTKLTLKGSQVRKAASIDIDLLVNVTSHTPTSIATSNAQNDGGLFELNFRDERYLPFEGAGAISTWNLELPSKLRPFNYDTISDVIIHISYTAKDDGVFRTTVENQIADILTSYASHSGLDRLISLKHEFPSAFHKLLDSSGNTQVAEFELTQQHFPYFLVDKNLILVSPVTVYLKPKGKDAVTTPQLPLKVNNTDISNWSDFVTENSSGNLKKGEVKLSGNFIKKWTIDAGTNRLDKEELDDILILLKYKCS